MPTLAEIRAKLMGETPPVATANASAAKTTASDILQRIRDRKAAEAPPPPTLDDFPMLAGKDIPEVKHLNRVVVQNSTKTYYVVARRIPLRDGEFNAETFIQEVAAQEGVDPEVMREQLAEEFRGEIMPGSDLAFLTFHDDNVDFTHWDGEEWVCRDLRLDDPRGRTVTIHGTTIETLLKEVAGWRQHEPLPGDAFIMKVQYTTEYVVV